MAKTNLMLAMQMELNFGKKSKFKSLMRLNTKNLDQENEVANSEHNGTQQDPSHNESEGRKSSSFKEDVFFEEEEGDFENSQQENEVNFDNFDKESNVSDSEDSPYDKNVNKKNYQLFSLRQGSALNF